MAASEKARCYSSAFFIVWTFFSLTSYAACPPDRIDQQVTVRHVQDGDSLLLTDGRRIRLIGINTPELSRDNRPTEPGANEAKYALYQLVASSDNKIGLRLGVERKDRYGRTLAHAFLPDGSNLTAALLSQGSGFPVTITPNVWQADCYRQQSEQARKEKLGVWKLSAWRAKSSFNLPTSTRGFQRIVGVVEKVNRSNRALWLNLSGGFAIRIDQNDLPYFSGVNWNQWQNKRVEVTGWVYSANGDLRMNLHHPNNIKRLN